MKSLLSAHAPKVGVFFILLYAVCILWSFFITDSAVADFHLTSLKLTFPGFSGLTAGSVLWGAALSFIYGFVGSLVFHGLHRDCCRK